jgi:hypothetical protein
VTLAQTATGPDRGTADHSGNPPTHAGARPQAALSSSERTVARCTHGITVYGEFADGSVRPVDLSCGKRQCPACRSAWVGRQFKLMMGGIEYEEPATIREMTLTAPGLDVLPDADAVIEWNRTALARFHRVVTRLRRAAPGLQFVRAIELQSRGAYHLHCIVKGAPELTARRVRAAAVAAGFGHRATYAPVRKPGGFAYYLAGYMLKSRDVFPPGTRVVEASRGWSPDYVRAVEAAAADEARAEPVGWYESPPPDRPWEDWRGTSARVRAERLEIRRDRRELAVWGHEVSVRAMFARWAASPRGEAARARRTRDRRSGAPSTA